MLTLTFKHGKTIKLQRFYCSVHKINSLSQGLDTGPEPINDDSYKTIVTKIIQKFPIKIFGYAAGGSLIGTCCYAYNHSIPFDFLLAGVNTLIVYGYIFQIMVALILLGAFIEWPIRGFFVLFVAFITYDMCYGNQKFANKIRNRE